MKKEHKWKWLGYIRCPKCGRMGTLKEDYMRNKPWHKWSGPYYMVNHRRYVKNLWDKEKYRELRAIGLSREKATTRSNRIILGYDGYCYLGTKINLNELRVGGIEKK